MKKLIISSAIAVLTLMTTACTTTKTPDQKTVGMANPASEFCVSIGGQSIIKKDAQGGSYGVCKFADNQEIDEWKLYRDSAKIIIEGDTIKK